MSEKISKEIKNNNKEILRGEAIKRSNSDKFLYELFRILNCHVTENDNSTNKNIIILLGFGQSGNSTVRDYLKEFSNVHVMEREDFLIKYGSGLLDLRSVILNNNNYYTFDSAVKKFISAVLYYYPHYKNSKPESLIYYTAKFISKLCKSVNYVGKKPFNWHEKLFDENQEINNYIFISKNINEFNLDDLINKYLYNMYSSFSEKEFIVFVNSIQYNALNIDIFNNFKIISCKRDVRDVYLDFKLNAKGSFIPLEGFEGVDGYFSSVFNGYPIFSHNILNLDFENLILNYDNEAQKINNFLGLDKNNHIHKKIFFNPDLSISNIAIWKKYKDDPIVQALTDRYPNLIYGECNA